MIGSSKRELGRKGSKNKNTKTSTLHRSVVIRLSRQLEICVYVLQPIHC